MAQLQAELKRAILDEIWEISADGAVLADVIKAFKSARWDPISSGRLILSTSGNSYSVTFSEDLQRKLGPDQMFMLGQEFKEAYSDSVDSLTQLGTAITDDAVFTLMMGLFDTVREVGTDRTLLRMGGSFR